MKEILKELFFRFSPRHPLPPDRAVILMYHSISERKDFFSAVSPKNFERQMAYLAAHEYSIISLTELVRRLKDCEPLGGAVVLTFDDGYKDNYKIAFPILKKYHFPATIFLVTGHRELSHQEIQEMSENGRIEFMPHTVTHLRYTGDNREAFMSEALESRKAIEALTSYPADIFAYPAGKYDDVLAESVGKEGFVAAVTVQEGTVGPESDLFRLPRVSIDRSTTFAQFKGKLSCAIDRYQKYKTWL